MVDLIVACTENLGIGYQNKLPWHSREELSLFSRLTQDSILIVGKNTLENLPYLPRRTLYAVSSHGVGKNTANDFYIFSLPEHALQIATSQKRQRVFIAGGGQLYQHFLTHHRASIRKIYLSMMKGDYRCDTFLNGFSWADWKVVKKEEYTDFYHYELQSITATEGSSGSEKEYLDLLRKVATQPVRETRNGRTVSTFFETLTFDLRDGFPLVTTKKMFWRGIVEELLFFWRGHTDSKELEERKIMIWRGNTDRAFLDKNGKGSRREGMMGPMYGYQWRYFGAPYDEATGLPKGGEGGVDQLRNVVELIQRDPSSRRILLTDYNPAQAGDGVLYPCHSIINQFYVEGEYLDMFTYNRSSDLFLGLPFNIAMYGLFLTLIAKLTKKVPRKLYIGLGDAHLYEVHKEAVEEQLKRETYPFPRVVINKEIHTVEDVEKLEVGDILLENYVSHPTIRADMVA